MLHHAAHFYSVCPARLLPQQQLLTVHLAAHLVWLPHSVQVLLPIMLVLQRLPCERLDVLHNQLLPVVQGCLQSVSASVVTAETLMHLEMQLTQAWPGDQAVWLEIDGRGAALQHVLIQALCCVQMQAALVEQSLQHTLHQCNVA